MKKKLVSLLLCIAMLITGASFAGCEDSNSTNNSSDSAENQTSALERSSMTLSLWVPTGDDTTEEALYAVEAAINSITQSEFDTAIKLYGIPDSQYDEVIKNRIKEIEERKAAEEQAAIDRRKEEIEAAKNGETLVEGTTAYVNPNMDGDYSLVVRGASGYTNIERNQLDIFLIRGCDDYQYYIDNFYVQSLNESVSGACKSLTTYIFPAFFEAATYEGTIYGIPNNHEVGQYTYFLVNKDLVAAEYLDPAKLTSLAECESFIEDVVKYHKEYTPIYGDYSPSYYKFFSGQDQDTFSVLASRVTPGVDISSLDVGNIFSYTNYTNNYYLYKKYTEMGYVSKDESKEFAVGYVTCTASEITEYSDDYYVNVFKCPEGKKEDYLQSMFAVSCFSKSVDRSMEIITMLNTNTELRTILQYGAKDTHWKYDEENSDVIVKLSDDYKMNLIDTGNVYMTYPDYGVDLTYWDDAKAQNLQSYLPVTFNFVTYQNEDNAELMKEIDKLSAQIWSEMQAMTADEFKSNVSKFQSRVNNNVAYQKLTYIPSDKDEKLGRTEENGWKASGSVSYLWQEYVALSTGNTTD